MRKLTKLTSVLLIISLFTLVLGAVSIADAKTLSKHIFGSRTLTLGSSGTDVAQLQTFLKGKEVFKYKTITGYFGIITKNAVTAYQKANGLKATGKADTATFKKIIAQMAKPVSPAPKPQNPAKPPAAKPNTKPVSLNLKQYTAKMSARY